VIVSAGLLITALTACSSGTASSGDCPPSGDASKLVEATGDFGTEPEVSFPTPIKSDTTQATTIIAGDGPAVETDDLVRLSWAVYDGETAEPIQAYPSEPGYFALSQLPEQLAEGLTCQRAGARVAMVVPASALQQAGAASDEKKDTVVVVADIDQVIPSKATGADRPIVESGFPSVVTAPDGTPGLTIPKSDPPTQLKVATLKQGDGPTVKKDDTLIVQYSAALWKEQRVYDSTWSQGTPKSFPLEGNLPGVTQALTGKQVGSQILIVIPPKLAYGEDGSNAVPANSTVIYVVDILGILPKASAR